MLESKRKALIFLLLAIILAATSGYLILQKVQSLNEDLGTFVTVYKANDEIPSRKILTPDDVSTEQIPQRYLRDEYITSDSQLRNKVSLVPLSEDEIITTSMLKEASAITDENTRLISLIQSEKIFFDEPLFPGDRVDILVSHKFNDEPVTELFMEDVNVIQTGSESGKFSGARVEIPFDRVTELVHLQNYADSLRIVRAKVSENMEVSQPQRESEAEESSEDEAEENQDEQDRSENQEETDEE
ncbi:flagella basal body P-ring formation protein FlgA [Piscibacillus sp. B03]|uniref:flagella basal body P-ring formation protein FlgA n=1 Tax=Piscibacillus sp. B03 TaxID=3457430 RepID=UPI003FCDF23D